LQVLAFASQGRQEQSRQRSSSLASGLPGCHHCRTGSLTTFGAEARFVSKQYEPSIFLIAAPIMAGRICLFGMPVLVAGALRARAGKGSDDFHRRAFMQQWCGYPPLPLIREAESLSYHFFLVLSSLFNAILFTEVGGIFPKTQVLDV
jgi:hypothetical protein